MGKPTTLWGFENKPKMTWMEEIEKDMNKTGLQEHFTR